jgi:peptide/nickel transport system permease protein|nr:ABC transporter permease [uncultured Halomonas sp.]|tara:strand:+ start:4081 stop:5028 length:948 start_codon:yes stop_codon:yes gene_type:complete
MNTTQATASTPHVSPKPMSLMADDSQLLGKPPKGYWRNVGGHLKHDKVALVASGLLLLIALAAIFAPWIAPHDPYETNMLDRLTPPVWMEQGSSEYLLGTDELGRDILTRLIYGGRVTLMMSMVPVGLALLIGSTLGLVAGYVGGRVNMLIMRVTDVFYAFPSILLAVAISGAMGGGIVTALFSLTLIFIPPLARITESITTKIRNEDYVQAARATGASVFTIIRVHVLSNVLGPVLIYASSLLSVGIVVASGLSFLGLGVSPPIADWGLMLNALREAIYVAPTNAALPGVIIFITCMSFNLLSDSLRSAMDVRL